LILTPILILALSLEINDSNSCGVTFEESTFYCQKLFKRYRKR
jgi:hypothetical protein